MCVYVYKHACVGVCVCECECECVCMYPPSASVVQEFPDSAEMNIKTQIKHFHEKCTNIITSQSTGGSS